MRVATGHQYLNQIRGKAEALCPEVSWECYHRGKDFDPAECEAAVLVGDAYSDVFKNAILQMKQLRWVHTENSGVDSPFYRTLLERGVALTRSPAANAPEVAEFVFAQILNQVKQLESLRQQQRDRHWQQRSLGTLSGRTMLIVGLGAIGSRVAAIADTFGMKVLGLRQSADPVAGVSEQGTLEDLATFLPRADFIVLAIPLTEESTHLLGESQLTLLRDQSMVINVARGGVIDTAALKSFLKQREDVRFCLDVMPREPWPADDDLWESPQVFLTPHTAWSSPAFRRRAGQMWLENLERFIQGHSLRYEVQP